MNHCIPLKRRGFTTESTASFSKYIVFLMCRGTFLLFHLHTSQRFPSDWTSVAQYPEVWPPYRSGCPEHLLLPAGSTKSMPTASERLERKKEEPSIETDLIFQGNRSRVLISPPLKVPCGSKMSPPSVTVLVITCLSNATFFALSKVSQTSVEPNTYSMALRRSDSYPTRDRAV